MRRSLFSLLALCFMGAMAGCCNTHGVCDCEYDDHCATRAPWIQVSHVTNPATTPPTLQRGEDISVPTSAFAPQPERIPRTELPVQTPPESTVGTTPDALP